MNLRNCFPVCLLAVVLFAAACGAEDPAPSGSGEPARVLPPAVRVENPGSAVSDGFDGFVSVSAGLNYSCGLRAQGEAECWFWSEPFPRGSIFRDRAREIYRIEWTGPPSTEAPGGEFVAVEAAHEVACGLRPGGMVECWGPNPLASVPPPGGEFVSVSVGLEHVCGVRPDAGVECWGLSRKRMGALFLPGGKFTAMAVGSNSMCGLRPGGAVECWGNGYNSGYRWTSSGWVTPELTPPEGKFKALSTGGGGDVCGLRPGGEVECWGNYDYTGYREGWSYLQPPEGVFESVAEAAFYACGLRPGGEAECWTKEHLDQVDGPPQGEKYIHIGVHPESACGVRVDNTIRCWHKDSANNDRFIPIGGRYAKYVTGPNVFSCGLRIDGTVKCFGVNVDGERLPDPSGVFESLSVGYDHACGLRPGGEVACWGSDEFGKSTPPAGVFAKVFASGDYSCGLRPGGELECWGGNNGFLQSKAASPRERLVFVDAGWGGHYSLKGEWEWYSDYALKISPVSLVRIPTPSYDWGYSCGLREDGTLFCWGDEGRFTNTTSSRPVGEDFPVLAPPGGVFADVGVGARQACALRPTGEVECWGLLLVREEDANRYRYEPGSYVYGEGSPQGSRFVSLTVGGWHACAIDASGGVECWALEDGASLAAGEGFAKSAVYESISAGYYHTCGVRSDGGVDCWGAFDDLY